LAGEPLLGNLIGYRKLTVGDRDWRIVWRVLSDDRGGVIVEISEVWAIGARSDAEVHTEMATRAAQLPESPPRRSLMNVIDELGKRAKGVQARPPLEARVGPEQWLIDRLVHTAGLDRDTAGAIRSHDLRRSRRRMDGVRQKAELTGERRSGKEPTREAKLVQSVVPPVLRHPDLLVGLPVELTCSSAVIHFGGTRMAHRRPCSDPGTRRGRLPEVRGCLRRDHVA